MKLRLNSDTLRLRLTRSEIAQLGESGMVEEKTQFAPGQALWYSVECVEIARPEAALQGNFIRVKLPRTEVKQWIETDQTGIEATQGSLRVLVEKDFKCLHRDSQEDADAFPNPLE
jgi:hypothetical protein